MRQPEDNKTKDLLSKTHRGAYMRPYKNFEHRTFGGFIAMLRKKRLMTQIQYAGMVGISRRALIMVERLTDIPEDMPYHGVVFKIAALEMGCSVQGPRAQIKNAFAIWKDSTQ
jgi:DNA-binding XRE family transcriptional regulator